MTGFKLFRTVLPLRALATTLIITASAAAAAQATEPQIAQTSSGACAGSKTQPQLDHPDIFTAAYTPPKPNPKAITAPCLIYSVDPQFPSDAPKGPFSGITKVALLVDTDGKAQQVHIEQSLGTGFDKTAIVAIQKYQFKPATRYGKPVLVKICVEINYRR